MTLRFISLLLIFSAPLFAVHPIFTCIDHNDGVCIKREISFDKSWKSAKNANGQTPLIYAIARKKFTVAEQLIESGAGRSDRSVIVAAKLLFGIEKESLLKEDVQQNDVQQPLAISISATWARRIITAIAHDPEREKLIPLMAKVVDLYCSRTDLARSIRDLRSENILSKRDMQLIVSHYDSLFLQDEMPSTKSIAKITSSLISFDCNQDLVRFLIAAYRIKRNKLPINEYALEPVDKDSMVASLVNAIGEHTRSFFAELPPKLYIRHVFVKDPVHMLEQFERTSNDLSNFVRDTIVFPEERKQRAVNFYLWRAVYDKLLQHHDLHTAFFVALGLTMSEVREALGEQFSMPIPLLDPLGNFNNYRLTEKRLGNTPYLPSLNVLRGEFSSVGEAGLFYNSDDNVELLNEHFMGYLLKFRTKYSKVFLETRGRKIRANNLFVQKFSNLPDLKSDAWDITYRLLMTSQSVPPSPRRRSIMMQYSR